MKFDMKFTAHIDKQRPEKVLKALWKGVDFGALRIQRKAKIYCPVKTGKLRRSIEVKSIPGGKSISPDTDYDVYVEFGTFTYYLEPKSDGGVLHWVDESGNDCFSKGHWMPPKPAQPYMRPALQESRKPISDRTAKWIREALK